jgi:hypothetical protein
MAIKQIFIPEDKSRTYKLAKEGYNIFFMDLVEIQETKHMCVSCGQGKVQTFSEILTNDNDNYLNIEGTVILEDERYITEELVTDGEIIDYTKNKDERFYAPINGYTLVKLYNGLSVKVSIKGASFIVVKTKVNDEMKYTIYTDTYKFDSPDELEEFYDRIIEYVKGQNYGLFNTQNVYIENNDTVIIGKCIDGKYTYDKISLTYRYDDYGHKGKPKGKRKKMKGSIR